MDTFTLKTTVDGAFHEVLALERRRRALLAERGTDLPEMTDLDTRRGAAGAGESRGS